MTEQSAELIICGAGIAGISIAYELAVKHHMKNIMLVDPRSPLSLTSDKSSECYRNWWPGPDDAMVCLMNRSIDLLEQLHQEAPGRLHMNRRGYVYATTNPESIEKLIANAQEISGLGAGQVRIHRSADDKPEYIPITGHDLFDAPAGADILLDQALIREHFPYLTQDTVAILHTRRCGWFAAQQFGMYMLEKARESGVELVKGHVEEIIIENNAVRAVEISTDDSVQRISTTKFVNAAGPFQKNVGQMLAVDIPVYNELHIKMALNDPGAVIPRDMPLIIWNDPIRLAWSDEEKAFLAESDDTQWMLDELPAGIHGRAEGSEESTSYLLQWSYQNEAVEAIFPIPIDEHYPEILLRGMAQVIPGLSTYVNQMPKPFLDGGYYTRTRENRPLIGPLPVTGAYIFGGLGGSGLQIAAAGAELLAAHITETRLPDYAPAFSFDRYQNSEYIQLLDEWGSSGQI